MLFRSLGLQQTLTLGDLDAERDWGYAADFVAGMWQILQHREPDDYVLATGTSHSIRDLLQIAFQHLGLDWQQHVSVDQRFFRPADPQALLGNPSKARQVLGWCPSVSFEQMVRMMVDSDLLAVQQNRT